ncbi:MAG: hypothetical protein AAFR04_06005 [Pseudomonadota bacterium]
MSADHPADIVRAVRARPLERDEFNARSHDAREATPAYTLATLVTRHDLYANAIRSLRAGGFAHDCEYLSIDNAQRDDACAYRQLNALLNEARAPYVILCHQDIELIGDGRQVLDEKLAHLTAIDPAWAVAGNAGGVGPGRLALRISDPHGEDQNVGPLPQLVSALDENFLVVRRASRVGLSHDLTGFHLYGADLCLNADVKGHSCYVIDFHLRHLSAGNKDASFEAVERRFREKWSRALRPRWLQTTCALLYLSGVAGDRMLGAIAERSLEKLARRLPGARGWRAKAPVGDGRDGVDAAPAAVERTPAPTP